MTEHYDRSWNRLPGHSTSPHVATATAVGGTQIIKGSGPMTTRAPGSNAPPRNREKKALNRLEALTANYVAKGMTEEDARQRALDAMRDNPRRDWRAG